MKDIGKKLRKQRNAALRALRTNPQFTRNKIEKGNQKKDHPRKLTKHKGHMND